MKHAEMRLLLRDAFARVFSRDATIPELQCLQAVAWLESSYGDGWKPPGNGSFNLGAIQAGGSWTGPTFQYTDTRPNSDGSSTPYVTKFRKYATPIDGAIDLVKVVYLNRGRDKLALVPAGKGDTLGFSRGLHTSGYYEGYGKTVEDRIRNHHKAVERSIRQQAVALHEALPADLAASPVNVHATLKRGATGPAVELMQHALNKHGAFPPLKVDGQFGQRSFDALRIFQQKSKLVADGICGERTWRALLTEPAPGTDPAPAA
jgi:hypothetical protein